MNACRIITSFIMFSASTLAFAQSGAPTAQNYPISQTSASTFHLKLTTTIGSLDVVVTDAKGNPVDGLKKDDFHIFEGKKPQTIRSFEGSETHNFPKDVSISSTADLDAKIPEAPVTILVLDEANTTFEDASFARYSIKKYLATQPEHLTQPTELLSIDITHLKVLRDYTTSKAEILHALDHYLQEYPWHLKAGWEEEEFEQRFMALNQVAKAVAGHPGHKNTIWIGQELPTLDLTQTASSSLYEVKEAIEASTNQLPDSRITLHIVNPAGVTLTVATDDGGNVTDNDPFGSSMDFNAMAKATGGHAFFGRNDVNNLIGGSVRYGDYFYTLTYRPASNDSKDNFRSIHVVMNRPGLTATTREGYYTKPAGAVPAMQTAEQQDSETGGDLVRASENQLVYDGVHLKIQRDSSDPEKFLLHMSAHSWDWQHDGAGPPVTNISLLVATFNHKGKLIKREAKVLTLHGNPGSANALDYSVNLSSEVDTSDAARIRFVVRSGTTGKIGAQNAACVNGLCPRPCDSLPYVANASKLIHVHEWML